LANNIMKILIAISSKEYSEPTLDVGMKISRELKASTTILDVGEKINEFSMKDVDLANEIIESWNIGRPGMDVLEWAYFYLIENDFIDSNAVEESFSKKILHQKSSNRAEIHLEGLTLERLNLILRNGDIIDELRDEVKTYNYDLMIIGGSGKRSMAHDFIQYIESSIFIVNNFNPDKNYRILLAVDDSPGTSKAVKYGVRVSQAFGITVDLILVSKSGDYNEDSRFALERAKKMMRRCGIKTEVFLKVGDPVLNIVEAAGEDHIIIMGASTQSPLAKFFMGSKPLNVIGKSNCPVLIVK
jgi:nucleotide-binding universal stress UspA family protein